MYGIFSEIKSLLRTETVSIDNWIFKLHYKLTVILLVTFSIVVNTRQFFGDPIKCTSIPAESSLSASYIEAYCWFNIYSLVSPEGSVFLQDSKIQISTPSSEYQPVYQTYYQWIGVVLLLQAACFYFPRFLWKEVFEEGRVKELIDGLQVHIPEEEEVVKRQKKLVEYMAHNEGRHRFYAFKFFFCEILNFCNVIAQIFLTDWFLGHTFLKYGVSWILYEEGNRLAGDYHPSYRYFPKETVCDLVTGGSGGANPNKLQVRCVLPVQILNEKIYLFLCFYFIALGLISALLLVYRALVLLLPGLRCYILQRRAWTTDAGLMRSVTYGYDAGDWFLIHLIMKNMSPFTFGRLIQSLCEIPGRNNRLQGIDTVDQDSNNLLAVYTRRNRIEEKQK